MTFLEYIDSATRTAINHLPKHTAQLLLQLYPERFPLEDENYDSVQNAMRVVDGDPINIDFKPGVQYSYLSIQDYDDESLCFIDLYTEWGALETDLFDSLVAIEDTDIDIENLI